jgi:hypothetical protein
MVELQWISFFDGGLRLVLAGLLEATLKKPIGWTDTQ